MSQPLNGPLITRRAALAISGASATASFLVAPLAGWASAAATRPATVKWISFIRRKSGLSHEAFVARWRDQHAPLAWDAPGLAAYGQAVLQTAGDDGYDGVAELHFATEADRMIFFASPHAARLAADAAAFTEPAPGGSWTFVTDETVIIPERPGAWFRGAAPGTGQGIKGITLLKRKAGTTHQAFAEHWRTVHAPLAIPCPGISRYTQSLIRPAPDVAFDGVAELYFEDQAARGRYDASPQKAALLADGTLFMGQGADMVRLPVGEETVVAPRGWTPRWSPV